MDEPERSDRIFIKQEFPSLDEPLLASLSPAVQAEDNSAAFQQIKDESERSDRIFIKQEFPSPEDPLRASLSPAVQAEDTGAVFQQDGCQASVDNFDITFKLEVAVDDIKHENEQLEMKPEIHTSSHGDMSLDMTSHTDMTSHSDMIFPSSPLSFDETPEKHSNSAESKYDHSHVAFTNDNDNNTKVSKKETYNCDICDKVFNDKSNLRRHKIIHSGEKPHACPVCHKTFARTSVLKKHQKIHTGDKQFRCNKCGKGFICATTLQRHEMIHNGVKYSCDFCGKTFGQKSNFDTHRRAHTRETPFCCLSCGKAFRHNSSLKVHIRTHTGERPFSCEQCEKAFTSASGLNAHIRTHRAEKPYECIVCNKAYSVKRTLDKHIRLHNGETSI